jgi:hypothetical protein
MDLEHCVHCLHLEPTHQTQIYKQKVLPVSKAPHLLCRTEQISFCANLRAVYKLKGCFDAGVVAHDDKNDECS